MSNIPQQNPAEFPFQTSVSAIERQNGLVIGVVGGIASGKSEIAKILKEYGAVVFSADNVGHRLLNRSDIRLKIVEIFGEGCLDSEGLIDRKYLAKCFFSGPSDQLSRLEAILHPVIRAEAIQAIDDFRSHRNHSLLVLDAPLLLEAGWHALCDKIIFIDTPIEIRLANVRSRRWEDRELIAREKTQLPLEAKRAYASDILDNSGSLTDLRDKLLGLPWLAKLL